MREEVSNWLKQAEADLRKVDALVEKEQFDGAVFFSQQAAEKALKAVCLEKTREGQKSHSIIYLAQLAGVPREMLSGIRDLNPEYLTARYPDMAAGVPAELYDREIAARHRETAKKVLEWSRKRIRG